MKTDLTTDLSVRQISLIGLGLLGSAVARRLMSLGWRVVGYDLNRESLNKFGADGGQVAESLIECVEGSQYCIFCLPDEKVSREVLAELLSRLEAPRELTIFDMTTGDPDVMKENFAICAAQGVSYLDTCVAGSSVEAEQGEAILMVGGDVATFESCREVLDFMSRQVFYVGLAGDGARMKLVTNLVLGLERLVLAEGFHLAKSVGLNLNKTLEILKAGPARSHVMTTKGEKMIEADWVPQARLGQHWKDVNLILSQSDRSGIDLPLSKLHAEILEQCHKKGWGEFDNSAVYLAYSAEKSESTR
ncbi:NAD(P)-dependent oxidoreductase [Planctomycetaceae bacterium]|jgi:3-hydroxyisobutyrate dehydrogenase-like beta-hydroxyacid dehydrogenase|nr:NAD(P)-dependent oxidoreductase [Planctomycetaceae bacterium]MDC0262054.1 NAD(P)-dependent oxidoreductase [Planctomycetaceae bacterium]MDC0273492.1 NAD(P)-dependent oxidoreductase [Planctomycetaceae bacterium]MDC0308618.1 NAD(P)-dependent oxidoreductase [Planctomycetaceae bacterium]MDG2390140.1 NAD(P)-dependent oxidoreductase [Planctomycetaceae bacterium]